MTDADTRVADRIAIDDLLTHYATLIDGGRFDELDQVFTPDAVLDYRSAGGIRGPFPDVRAWLASVLHVHLDPAPRGQSCRRSHLRDG